MSNEDMVRSIKSQRLRCPGQVSRMEESSIQKGILNARLTSGRAHGRPGKRWKDGVKVNDQKLGINGWKVATQDRDMWSDVTRKAKAHPEL